MARTYWVVLSLIAGLFGAVACQSSEARFDYWVLALSWSPEYCDSDQARPGSKQCSQSREFIVHGLWPQHERGYPEFCDTQSRVSERTADRLSALVPDRGLVFHQWKKHGSCSGMTPGNYFATLERAAHSIVVPSAHLKKAATRRVKRVELERAFIEANPGLAPEAITLECSRQYLREVRICLDRDLKPRACGVDVTEACGTELSVRPGRTE
ncbi:MAG: ribonuclease T2 family protein [Panacagrimonas sp.]